MKKTEILSYQRDKNLCRPILASLIPDQQDIGRLA
jgi:hypothetical protein